ncbi:MAG: hypothetical protein LBM56_04180 [Burkholderiaceae bacterium]|nr:hypothetical protein [Burkholderiaceae bacterium]
MGILSRHGIIKSDGVARSVRQSGLQERAEMANSNAAGKRAGQGGVAGERGMQFFAPKALQAAYVRLKTRLSEVGAKFDPEMYVAGATIALAYVQGESRFFSDFAIFMLGSFGDAVRPHLLSFYAGICNAPDVIASGLNSLTSYEQCLREYSALMQSIAGR